MRTRLILEAPAMRAACEANRPVANVKNAALAFMTGRLPFIHRERLLRCSCGRIAAGKAEGTLSLRPKPATAEGSDAGMPRRRARARLILRYGCEANQPHFSH